jgi:hypothetical protein
MKKSVGYRRSPAIYLIGLMSFYYPVADAEQVYKCVEGGKVSFTSNAGGQGCQSIELHVPQPNPVDAARQIEKNRAYALEEKKRGELKNNPEALLRTQNAKLAESVARAPIPKLPMSVGRKYGRGNPQGYPAGQ